MVRPSVTLPSCCSLNYYRSSLSCPRFVKSFLKLPEETLYERSSPHVVSNLSGENFRRRSQVLRYFKWSLSQLRCLSSSYLPKAAIRRNRIPFQSFPTPRSSLSKDSATAESKVAAVSQVSAPFTLQKQQRLYALLCAENRNSINTFTLYSPASGEALSVSSPLKYSGSAVESKTSLQRAWHPVGVGGLAKFHPSSSPTDSLTYRGRVCRPLSIRRVNHLGRNGTGQITVRYRGAGHFQRVRFLDFKRSRKNIFATVLRLEYDPGRSAHIALIQYDDGVLSYILAAQTTRPGDRVVASAHANVTPGNCLPLRNIPTGSIVHNVELRPGAGGQLIRAAGCYATVVAKDNAFVTLKLQSTEVRRFPLDCWASIGQVSNSKQAACIRGKAGASYWRGERPRTRGKAMNPVDHPHGGGTGKKGLKRPPVTKWGILCRGYKTRPKNKHLGLILRRKKANKLIKKFGELGSNL